MEARFATIELKLREECKRGSFAKEELGILVQRNRDEREGRFEILGRPYRRRLRDAMAFGRKGLGDGWEG